jgi:hypothetical protein
MSGRIERQRPAMGTWFAVTLMGEDVEHLAAVAEAVLDEVGRVERLLARFARRTSPPASTARPTCSMHS